MSVLTVLLALLALLSTGVFGLNFTGDTNRPDYSVYVKGEQVELYFTIHGADTRAWLNLELWYLNEFDNLLGSTVQLCKCDQNGFWNGTIIPDSYINYGFVRVMADLTPPGSGVYYYLNGMGSRAAGYLTYAIVPDPTKRPLFPASKSRWGMCAGFGPTTTNTMALLGTRWYYGGYQWGDLEPDYPGQFNAKNSTYDDSVVFNNFDGNKWKVYYMPTPYNARKYWTSFASNVATAFSAKYPDMDVRIYQITWEADEQSPSLFDAGNQQLVEIYELCYSAIHQADPKALVVGPTVFPMELQNTINLQSYNFSAYIDGFSMHAYVAEDLEEIGFIQDLRAELAVLYKAKGLKSLPFIETEHGFVNPDRTLELRAARWMLKVSLIILGEGGMNTWNFYLYDFDTSGFGMFYGLGVNSAGSYVDLFPNPKIAPKPMAPILAAATYLLDGCDGQGFFNNSLTVFGPTQIGYLFACAYDNSVVWVAWDYRSSMSELQIFSNYHSATVYDWMGNGFAINSQIDGNGNHFFGITLSNEPTYVKAYTTSN